MVGCMFRRVGELLQRCGNLHTSVPSSKVTAWNRGGSVPALPNCVPMRANAPITKRTRVHLLSVAFSITAGMRLGHAPLEKGRTGED